MELNAGQIKKVLLHCANWTVETGCKGCPYDGDCIDKDVMKDALALITSQEQRIKELTEENERLKKSAAFLADMPDGEIERIKTACLEKIELDVKAIRADTVRKMQERLDKHFCHDPAFLGVEQRLIMGAVDQIAKEMLEEGVT